MSKLAAQLYTVRDFCKTEEDIARSMEKIAAIGYDTVQVSGLGRIPHDRMRRIMDDNGLSILVTHNSYDEIANRTDELIEKHYIYGCKNVGLGSMPNDIFDRRTEQGFTEFAKKSEEIACRLKEAGLNYVYHNHNFEMIRFGKKTGLDIIYDNAPTLRGEIDTYWITAGGGDPTVWIDKLSGRMDLIHFKDMAFSAEGRQVFAEIGEGNLNWAGIIAACERNGIEKYIIEQDSCPVDPFESLRISFENLKAMGVDR